MKKSERGISKKVIASHYFPENNRRTASRKLRYWLHNDRDLLADLQAEGYDKEQSYLTPKQLEILRNYINDPLA